ncbi:MAG: hypothetical protein Q4P25_04810 [Tissierellia bacterium]|nr:hypothetical protein [Tissierellia bacterium]
MNKYGKTLFLSSIFILFIVIIIFSYSQFNRNYTQNKSLENDKLHLEIKKANEKWMLLKDDGYKLDEELNHQNNEFYKKYGYEFGANKEKEFQKVLQLLQSENKQYLREMEKLILDYSNYYSGDIYDSEELDGIIGNFTQMTNFVNSERFKNIPKELHLYDLIQEADGTIGYLKSLNAPSKKLDLLLFYSMVYSRNLNLMSKSEKIPPFELYRDIKNLEYIYSHMEKQGYQLGNLSSEKLKYLGNNFYTLMSHYYKNLGIIKSLEQGGENEK